MNETDKPTSELSGPERQQRSYEARMTRVAALIAQGYTLPAIARQLGMPSIASLRQLLAESEQLRDAYDKARDLRNEQLADDAVALADTLADANNAGLKLRIDARKWRVGLNRKDGKKEDKKRPDPEFAERLQHALDRAKKHDEEEMKRLRAMVEAEYAERYGVAVDKKTVVEGESDAVTFKE